jgi:hypothetical protein
MANEVATRTSTPMQQMERMAQAIAKSGVYGVKTTEEALALMIISEAEGIPAALAARDYHVIKGRPALKADTMLARFQQAGGRVDWKEYTDARVTGVFSHPQAGSVEISWDMARAAQAGLSGKDNWKTYPRAMLRSRVISEGVRTCYPGVSVGTYTVEEVQDMDPVNVTPEQTVTQAVQSVAATHALHPDEVAEHLTAINTAPDDETLRSVYATACKHANESKDRAAKDTFIAAYNARKTEKPASASTAAQTREVF